MNDSKENILSILDDIPEQEKEDKPKEYYLQGRKFPEEPVKKKKGNDPTAPRLEAGDITKMLSHEMQVRKFPKIDMSDSHSVMVREQEYFELCIANDMRPTLSGLATALGTTTATLYNIRNDLSHLNTKEAEIIKGAYQMLEQLWEDYLLAGKINPVSAIFYAKNVFSDMYQDSKEVIVKHELEKPKLNDEEIRKKYLEENDAIDVDVEELN